MKEQPQIPGILPFSSNLSNIFICIIWIFISTQSCFLCESIHVSKSIYWMQSETYKVRKRKLVKNKTQLFSNFFTNTLSYIIMKIQYNNPYYILFIDTLYIQKDCSKSLQPNSAGLSFWGRTQLTLFINLKK